jgi:hypothetical protein
MKFFTVGEFQTNRARKKTNTIKPLVVCHLWPIPSRSRELSKKM